MAPTRPAVEATPTPFALRASGYSSAVYRYMVENAEAAPNLPISARVVVSHSKSASVQAVAHR